MLYELKILEKYYGFPSICDRVSTKFCYKKIRKIKFKLKIQCYVNIKNKKKEIRKRNIMSWNVYI